jgi:hypothetical protein
MALIRSLERKQSQQNILRRQLTARLARESEAAKADKGSDRGEAPTPDQTQIAEANAINFRSARW